jgi:hypothetical protein
LLYMLKKSGLGPIAKSIMLFLNELVFACMFLMYIMLGMHRRDEYACEDLPVVIRCAETWKWKACSHQLHASVKVTAKSEGTDRRNRVLLTLMLNLDYRQLGLVNFAKLELSSDLVRAVEGQVHKVTCCALADSRAPMNPEVTCKGYAVKRGGLNPDFKLRYFQLSGVSRQTRQTVLILTTVVLLAPTPHK